MCPTLAQGMKPDEAQPTERTGRFQTFHFRFEASTQGPMRCLGLFAQIERLPERFICERSTTSRDWNVWVVLDMESFGEAYDRVLSKVTTLPTFLGHDDRTETCGLSADQNSSGD